MERRGQLVRQQGWPYALTAVFVSQMGTVTSRMVMEYLSPETTAWMRTSFAALIMLVIVRPSVRGLRARDWALIACLGASSILMSIFFLAGIAYIPIGMALAIEYMGPMTLAALSARRRSSLVLLGVALLGVLLVTEPWLGTPSLRGVFFVLIAGAFWALYIVLNQRSGDRFDGPQGLALSLPIASLVGSVVGIPGGAGDLTPGLVAACLGLGFLNPGIPFLCESAALRRMNRTAFGTLLALAPAAAASLATLFLGEHLSAVQWAGITFVIVAGILSQRHAERTDPQELADEVAQALEAEAPEEVTSPAPHEHD